MQAIQLAASLICALALVRSSWAQQDAIAQAVAALERGDYSAAEQDLKAHLHAHAKDGEALSVLAVALDQEKKYSEADSVYRQALSNSPPTPALLNNYGNHLIATGKSAEARKAFVQVIALEPGNSNALVQLARMSLERKAPAEALAYLDRIPIAARDRPDSVILRMQANYRLGRQQDGDAILDRISASAETNARQSFALGVALSSAGQYEKAEKFFSKTLEGQPSNFEALYDLGLAASHAGHNERARSVLEQAVAQQPENVDALYDLAVVNVALDRKTAALELLAKASQLAPQRTNVLQLEARTAAALGYFADAANAWDVYLKLVPGDDVARRERAFAETATGEKMDEGLAELSVFVRKHPSDPAGYYELGTAEAARQPEEALKALNHALLLQPDLVGAHSARGLLLYRQGKSESALADFQFVAEKEPENGMILDRLGEIYMALDRTTDALPVLRKAAELLPSNSTVLLHLGRALSKTGQEREAATVFARCRELGPNNSSSPHPAGLVEFLGLSPAEQTARYRAGVERTVKNYPDNAEAQVRYLELLLEDGNTDAAATVTRALSKLKVSSTLLKQAVTALLGAKQYILAKQQLDQNGSLASSELRIDLALANFHIDGVAAGMNALDAIPASERGGDYYLVRAQMLEAEDRSKDAALSIQQAIHANPSRPELYRQAALLLIKNHDFRQAQQLLTQAAQSAPNNPEILLFHAFTLELAGDRNAADNQFKTLENHWPEWYKVWIGNAIVDEARQEPHEAETLREAAVALGAPASVAQLGETRPFGEEQLAQVLPVLFP